MVVAADALPYQIDREVTRYRTMEQYAIKGGNPLVGEVEIGGAKNAALPILAASIMTDETVYIDNMPDVQDTNVLLKAMKSIGVLLERTGRHSVTINAGQVNDFVVDDDHIRKIRAGYYLLGAMLGKYKHAEVALPGGCDIGCRAIDQHLKGFRALGADIRIEYGLIKAHAEKLKGAHIYQGSARSKIRSDCRSGFQARN